MEVPRVRQHQDKHVRPFHLSNLNRPALGKYYASIFVEIVLEGSKSSVRSYLLLTNGSRRFSSCLHVLSETGSFPLGLIPGTS